MKNGKSESNKPYIKTFLSEGKDLMIVLIGGIRNEIRTCEDNCTDGFVFQKCRKVNFVHPLGTIYLHKQFGYLCAGGFWYRFNFNELILLSN
jgi:hypothetical protein